MRQLNFDLRQLCYRNRDGSYATQANRLQILQLVADQLHESGFKDLRATGLRPKHVQALTAHWQAQSLNSGTIKNRMAQLPWWAERICRRNIVAKDNADYGIAERRLVSTVSKARELTDGELAKVTDPYTRLSLRLQAAFGLRRAESIKIQPAWADRGDQLVLRASWCKGGRERTIPIRTAAQRQLLNEAKAVVGRGSLIPPSLRFVDQLRRFEYQCDKTGIHRVHGHRPPAPFDAILVHSRSRFFRDLFQFLHYERVLKKVGVKIVSITQQTGDDAAGEMASKLFSLFDEYQSKENAKHTQRAMQENARQGYWNGSVPPFGYRAVTTDTVGNRGRHKRRLEIDPIEAEQVREIYRLYLAGHDGNVMGMKAIASHLNRQGLRMRGRPWRIQKINDLLADPLYCGCFYFNRRDSRTHKIRPKPEWIAVSIPAIIDAGTFERAVKRRESANPKNAPPRATASPAPLVALLKCGHCGAAMTQATGKSGRYRYYKCTTRMAKAVDACRTKNLPRDATDSQVLGALSERVFTPKRVSLMLNELLRHQQQAKTAENARLITLKKDLDQATAGLDRLYQAIERGAITIDDTLRMRTEKLKARRSEILTEMAKLKDRQALVVRPVNPETVAAFCKALKERFTDPTSGLGKAYLRLLVDQIRLDGNELVVTGSHRRLADAIGFMQKRKLGEVPSFVRDWRARQDESGHWSEVPPIP